jgi:hypothetical protein
MARPFDQKDLSIFFHVDGIRVRSTEMNEYVFRFGYPSNRSEALTILKIDQS